MVSGATSKLYKRAVLPPAIPGSWSGAGLACSSSGSPARIFAIGETSTRCAIVRAPHHVVDTDDVSQANADGLLLEVLETTLPRKKSLGSMPFLNR